MHPEAQCFLARGVGVGVPQGGVTPGLDCLWGARAVGSTPFSMRLCLQNTPLNNFHQLGSSKFKEEHECFSVKELKAQTGKPLGVQTRLDTMGKIEHAQQLARGHLNSFPTKRI